MKEEFDLLRVRIVGFIAHQLVPEPAAMAAKLREHLEGMHVAGLRLMALSSLSGPTDLLFAKEALALRIPLVVVLLLSREEARKNFSEPGATEFDQILSQAAQVEILMLAPQADATTRLGQKLVDEADVLLAVIDEAGAHLTGNANEVVSYASRRHRPVICLNTEGVIVHNDLAERASSESELTVEQIRGLLGEAPVQPAVPEIILRGFHACDRAATLTAPAARRYAFDIVLANSVAAVASGVTTSFAASGLWGTLLTVIKFGCIAAGLWILFELRQRKSRDRWLQHRLRAEVCRSAIATWNSPLAIEPVSSDEVPELRSLLHALRYLRATRHHAADISLDGFRAAYAQRLIDQHQYFRTQSQRAGFLGAKLTPLSWGLTSFALLTSFFGVFLEFPYFRAHPPGTGWLFLVNFVPVLAPQIVSCIVAWREVEALSRKRARFAEMQKAMHAAMVNLIHCHSWEMVERVVAKAERHLISEVLEWYSFVKYSS